MSSESILYYEPNVYLIINSTTGHITSNRESIVVQKTVILQIHQKNTSSLLEWSLHIENIFYLPSCA
jgi:hypothetical protein